MRQRLDTMRFLAERGWGSPPSEAFELTEVSDDELRAEVERRIALEREDREAAVGVEVWGRAAAADALGGR